MAERIRIECVDPTFKAIIDMALAEAQRQWSTSIKEYAAKCKGGDFGSCRLQVLMENAERDIENLRSYILQAAPPC